MGNLLSTDRSWNPGPAGGWRKAGNDKATLGETGRVEGEGAGARTNPERQKCDGEPGRGADREMKQRKKRETVRPRKDRAAAPAYQLFQESSAGISINSNDKCGPLWHRLINSARGGTRQSKNSNHSMPKAWTSVQRERAERYCVLELPLFPYK